MGYTHYFELKADLTDEVLRDVERVIEKYPDLVLECDCDEPPLVSKELIRFNGRGENGHETFFLTPHYYAFCKTNKKPYDLAVCEVLLILKHYYRDDFELSSDGFWVNREKFEKEILDGYWNTALDNIRNEFGYTFQLKGNIEESSGHTYYSLELF